MTQSVKIFPRRSNYNIANFSSNYDISWIEISLHCTFVAAHCDVWKWKWAAWLILRGAAKIIMAFTDQRAMWSEWLKENEGYHSCLLPYSCEVQCFDIGTSVGDSVKKSSVNIKSLSHHYKKIKKFPVIPQSFCLGQNRDQHEFPTPIGTRLKLDDFIIVIAPVL